MGRGHAAPSVATPPPPRPPSAIAARGNAHSPRCRGGLRAAYRHGVGRSRAFKRSTVTAGAWGSRAAGLICLQAGCGRGGGGGAGPTCRGGGAGGGLRAQVVELVAAHGGQSAAEAEVTVTRWAREKRYLQDIWS